MNAQTKIEASAVPLVYQRIVAVQGALAKEGIGKNRTASTGRTSYAFRGIDDVYNALAPLLSEHGLAVLPRIISREVVERKSSSGNALFYVTVEAEFDFVAAEDGSAHTVRTFGEAMDSSDKATNKAMSAAYKYAAFMAFAIPTEGDNDSENAHHDVAPRQNGQRANSRQDGHDDRINEEQLTKIQMLLESTKTSEISFLKGMGAPEDARVFQLPQSMFTKAVKKLERKLAKMAKEETNSTAERGGSWDRPANNSQFADIAESDVPF